MTLENGIKDAISKKLEDGSIETIIQEQLASGVTKALSNLFGSYGDVTKIIEEQIKTVMVPYLEKYDYSEYVAKLDNVLIEVLKESALENKNLLKNFKNLMIADKELKKIKMTDIFNEWRRYVAENVDTDSLDIDYDDTPSYEYVECRLEVERDEDRWGSSSFEYATVIFECEQDEKMNFSFKISRWKKSSNQEWDIDYKTPSEISSLRNLNEFEIFLMKLKQAAVDLILDIEDDHDDVRPTQEPEISFG